MISICCCCDLKTEDVENDKSEFCSECKGRLNYFSSSKSINSNIQENILQQLIILNKMIADTLFRVVADRFLGIIGNGS